METGKATLNRTQEPEMVSPKTLAAMWDIEERTIRHWIENARVKSTPDPFPFRKFPGSSLVRIPLAEVRMWRDRALAGGYF